MGRELQGVLYYYLTNVRHAFLIFWLVIVAIFILSIVLDALVGGENMTIHFNLSFPIYIFAAALGFIVVKSTLPYLIKMGATRKIIYIGTVIFFIVFSSINALLANDLNWLLRKLTKSEIGGGFIYTNGEQTTTFNHIADFLERDNFLYQIIVDLSLSFFFITVFFIIGLMFYRFGLLGGFLFVGVIAFTFIYGMADGWLAEFFIDIFSDFTIAFFYQLALVGFGVYLLSFFLLRRYTLQ
ncbi:MAG: hypothetical protein GX374_07185 [Bacilli bacterium]|nr:hypothetical protein [Bacilli bacterium]